MCIGMPGIPAPLPMSTTAGLAPACEDARLAQRHQQRERFAEEPLLNRVGVADRGHARAHAPRLDQIEVAPEARLGFRVEFEGEAGCLGSERIEAGRC